MMPNLSMKVPGEHASGEREADVEATFVGECMFHDAEYVIILSQAHITVMEYRSQISLSLFSLSLSLSHILSHSLSHSLTLSLALSPSLRCRNQSWQA